MAKETMDSTILHEHRRIVTVRYILAAINFVAVLLGTLVTRYFLTVRGSSDAMLLHMNILSIINIVQLVLCLSDYITRCFIGVYRKAIVILSYLFGALWFLTTVGVLYVGSTEISALRFDLLIIAGLQLFSAFLAYIIWPSMDYAAVQGLTHHKVRDDLKKRNAKSHGYVVRYVFVCLIMVVIQAGLLVAYQLPPKVYDLFSETRALEYRLNEDKTGYYVAGVYKGTSSYVQVPETFNNLPVVGIAENALSDNSFLEQHKIDRIEIGVEKVNDQGKTVLSSQVKYIEKGGINSNRIETLRIPVSVVSMADGSVVSSSLKTVIYEAAADFSFSVFDCQALTNVTMAGDGVGNIVSLEGIKESVSIEVDKNIYNLYRKNNIQYGHSLKPILGETEFYVDFYTDCDYYIDSIFGQLGDGVQIGCEDLKNDSNLDAVSLVADTLAYIRNPHELGTAGAKENSAFRGWYLDRSFSVPCEFTEDGKVTFNKTAAVYAKWIDEYTGELNWGTYQPAETANKIYWTDEDVTTFPVITGREGYSEGVRWYLDGNVDPVVNSENISESVTLNGVWLLDKPTVDISLEAGWYDASSNANQDFVEFVYDETRVLTLQAQYSHKLDGVSHEGSRNMYELVWKTPDSEKVSESLQVQNVAHSGNYVLTVRMTSPYGEVAEADTNVNVTVIPKTLDIGNVQLVPFNNPYNALKQTVSYTGNFVHDNIAVDYTYYDENGTPCGTNSGVSDAGKYTVKADFKKNNDAEAANYTTQQLVTEFVITPRELSFVSWTNGDLTYNGQAQNVTMKLGGILGDDVVTVSYDKNEYTNAGEYEAIATGISNSNYSIAGIVEHCRYEWKISPKKVTVERWTLNGNQVAEFKVTYNGASHTVTAIADGICSGDTVNFTYATNANTVTAVNADEYVAKIIGVDNANYTFDATAPTAELAWEIEPRPLTATFNTPGTITYNGTLQGINAVISGIIPADINKFSNETFVYDGKNDVVEVNYVANSASQNLTLKFQAVNAATYRAAISAIDSNAGVLYQNYYLQDTVTKDFMISPKKLNFVNDGNYTYNGREQSLVVSVEGIITADLNTVQPGQFDTTPGTESIVSGEIVGSTYRLAIKGTNAGSYSVGIASFDNPNYTMSSYTDTIEIKKKSLTVNWTVMDAKSGSTTSLSANGVLTYNFYGYQVIATPNGVQNGEEVILNISDHEKKDVNNYTTVATLPSSYSNYTMNTQQIHWSIQPYAVDFKWNFDGKPMASTGTSFVYSTNPVTVTPQYDLLGSDTVTLSYSSEDTVRTDAGNYTVAISGLNNPNYTLGSGASVSWKITPKKVTVSWSADNTASAVYNGNYQGPTFTVSGLLETEDLYIRATVNSKTTQFAVLSASAVSKYAFVDAGLSVNADDYVFSVLSVLKYNQETESYDTNGNYEVTVDSFNFTIEKRPLTLSGFWIYENAVKGTGSYNSGTKLVYNTQNYQLSTEISDGLVNHLGETANVTLVYSGNVGKNYSTYTAKVTSLAGIHADNYSIPTAGATFSWSIHKKAINFDWDANNFIYNGSYQTQLASFLTGASSDFDGKVYTGDAVTLSYTGHSKMDVGTYTVSVVGLSNANYEIGSGSSYQWVISPKPITLSWNTTSLVYNGTVQTPKAFYADKASVMATAYTSVDSKNVGEYQITATALNDKNYVLIGNNTCTFKITPLTVVIGWKYNGTANADNFTYDATARTVSATALNLCDGDSMTFTYNKADRSVKNAGSYSFAVTSVSNPNYKLDASASNSSINLTVSKCTVTISWSASQFQYDGVYHSLTPTVTGVNSNDKLAFDLSENSLKDAGSLEVRVTALKDSSGNYQLPSSTKKTLTITPATVTITWSGSASVTYNGKSHELNATVTGIKGENVGFSYSSSGHSAVNAGTYTFTVSSLSNSNYTLSGTSNKSSSLTIQPQAVKITWEKTNPTYMYDGIAHTVVPTVVGISDGLPVDVKTYTSGNSLTNVGELNVQIKTLNNSNYTLTGATGSLTNQLTITPQPVVITWPDTKTWTYDGVSHEFKATVLGKNDSKVVSVNYATQTSIINAGTYTVSFALPANSNYTLEGTTGATSATVVVTPQKVKITWNGTDSTVYDGTSHTIQATVVGMNDNKNVSISYDTDRSFVSAGDYTVTFHLNNNNYTLEGASGSTSHTLSIRPQPVTITWNGNGTAEYTGNEHYVIASVKGSNDGRNVGFNYKTNNEFVTAGQYSTSIELTNSNYTLSGATGSTTATLKITPQPVNITWSGIGVYEYNGGTHTLTAVVTGATDGRTVDITYNGENSFVNAGTHQTTFALNDANYTLDGATGSVSASLTILPQTVTVTWSGTGTVDYDGATHMIEAIVTGSRDGHSVEFTYNGSNGFTEIGDYTVSIASLSSSNYTLENAQNLTSPTLSIVQPTVEDTQPEGN